MKRGQNSLALAAACLQLAIGAEASEASNLDDWRQICRSDRDLASRAPQLDTEHIQDAMERFHQHGTLGALISLPVREACLSFVATSASKVPTVVMFADQSPPENRRRADRPGPLRHFNEIEHHAERLAESDWLLMSGLGLDNSVESKIYVNRGVLAGADTYNQGYAARGDQLCAISLPESSYASFVRQQKFYDWNRLSSSDQEYVESVGDSVVFWHEVAHCNPDQALKVMSGTAEGSQLQDWTNRKLADQASCDASMLDDWQTKVEQRQLTATSPWDLAQGNKDPAILNDMIHYQVIQESLADRYGIRMADVQMGQSERGCSPRENITHPWYRMRLSLSISEPDVRYMTWLTPWLAGLDRGTTHQVLVDAHMGLMDLARKTLPSAMWMELSSSRINRPDRHEMTDPHGSANPDNVKSWSDWAATQMAGSEIGR